MAFGAAWPRYPCPEQGVGMGSSLRFLQTKPFCDSLVIGTNLKDTVAVTFMITYLHATYDR